MSDFASNQTGSLHEQIWNDKHMVTLTERYAIQAIDWWK